MLKVQIERKKLNPWDQYNCTKSKLWNSISKQPKKTK
jgi:hypothetical protein